MKQPIRLFALGLLTASLVTLIFFLFAKDGSHNTDNLANEDMITALKDEGYHVLNDSDYISLTVDEENHKKGEEEPQTGESERKSKDNGTEKKDKDKDKEKTYTLHIKSNMIPSDISDKLAEKDIIPDTSDFNKYLKDNDYDQQIQLGKFDVSNTMNKKEIAKVITK